MEGECVAECVYSVAWSVVLLVPFTLTCMLATENRLLAFEEHNGKEGADGREVKVLVEKSEPLNLVRAALVWLEGIVGMLAM